MTTALSLEEGSWLALVGGGEMEEEEEEEEARLSVASL